jgi:hypothetical protein
MEKLTAVLQLLVQERYSGVLTLEIFGEQDFENSMAAVKRSLQEVTEF